MGGASPELHIRPVGIVDCGPACAHAIPVRAAPHGGTRRGEQPTIRSHTLPTQTVTDD